ncbi:MAG: hypothetical protein R3E01_03365 [Pirellulaceae bacterium]|nr:PD40 domain-containing protein [Planctomycetales bacterium]
MVIAKHAVLTFLAVYSVLAEPVLGQIPQGYFTDVRNVSPNTGVASFDFAAFASADGLTLYFSDTRNNGLTPIPGNLGDEDMWMATRSSVDEVFSNLVNLGPGVNGPNADDVGSISSDGLTLYFGSNRSGNWDLYQATRSSTSEPFGNPETLGPGVNTVAVENVPRVSPDGLTMVYHVGLEGRADRDIWMASRSSPSEPFGNARSLDMNSDVEDWWPTISSDGLALITSDSYFRPLRPGGEGGLDIWVWTRNGPDEAFTQAMNPDVLWPGSELNSSRDAGYVYLSPDWPAIGSKIYFTGEVSAARGYGDVFQATWVPEPTTSGITFAIILLLTGCKRRRLPSSLELDFPNRWDGIRDHRFAQCCQSMLSNDN